MKNAPRGSLLEARWRAWSIFMPPLICWEPPTLAWSQLKENLHDLSLHPAITSSGTSPLKTFLSTPLCYHKWGCAASVAMCPTIISPSTAIPFLHSLQEQTNLGTHSLSCAVSLLSHPECLVCRDRPTNLENNWALFQLHSTSVLSILLLKEAAPMHQSCRPSSWVWHWS